MAATYFYDPRLKQTEDGHYYTDIFKYRRKKTTMVYTICDEDHKEVLTVARIIVNNLNTPGKKRKRYKKLIGC